MNREEFLRQLEGLLCDISEEERADALAFYRSYFEDAGEGNEAAILEELQSPQKVAESIKKDLGIDGSLNAGDLNAGNGMNQRCGVNQRCGSSGYGADSGYSAGGYTAFEEKKKNSAGTVAAWVIVAVLTSPIWLTILLVILCVLLGIVCALFGVAVAALAVMVTLVVVGFVLIGCGISLMATGNPPAGIGIMGGGFLVLALGVLAVVLTVWIFGGFLPWAILGIVKLCKRPFAKRKEREAA